MATRLLVCKQSLENLGSAHYEEHGTLTVSRDVADDANEVAAGLVAVLVAQDSLLDLIQYALAEALTAARDLADSHIGHVAFSLVLVQCTARAILLVHEQMQDLVLHVQSVLDQQWTQFDDF